MSLETTLNELTTEEETPTQNGDSTEVVQGTDTEESAEEEKNTEEESTEEVADPVADKEEARVSRALAKIAEREKALVAKEQAQKQFYKEKEEFNTMLSEFKAQPLKVLEKAGVTVDELIDYISTGKWKDPTPEDKIKELENKLSNFEKAQIEKEKAQTVAQQQQVYEEAKKYVINEVSDAAKYPLINQAGLQDAVFNHMSETYNNSKILLEIEDAAAQVENYLSSIIPQPKEEKKEEVKSAPTQVTSSLNNEAVGSTEKMSNESLEDRWERMGDELLSNPSSIFPHK